ncbi:uncharacterized protein Tco025E_03927 [Trypanosoma conorhini]|uniref:Uncharacterized protein n=1 Tax=Trypanosoma conorhini TaxID=83891 RepID=A0A422PRA4_9TRYP|nr:uncharacterized protein Tco025E_03927 [Trypanosoma conorhini]RNF20037.1 hypothetical protein Tco025E_03927 [Trypanosoma conorhini]
MHGNTADGAAGAWTRTADLLAEERSSLRFILDTLHFTFDHHRHAARSLGSSSHKDNNSRSSSSGHSHGFIRGSSGGGSAIASEAEVVELLGMLPEVLRSAVAPAMLHRKEQQRQSMTVAGVARPPPLSRHTTLYRLLFTPLLFSSSSSSRCGGECAVLECLGRALMGGGGTSRVETPGMPPEDSPQDSISATRETTWFAGTVTLAALHALGDVVQLCLHDTAEERRVGGEPSTPLDCRRAAPSSREEAVASQTAVLRDALGHALCQTGLFDYLWRSLLYQPVVHAQRVAMARVLCDVSHAGLLLLPDAIARARQVTSPAVWGQRVAECILSDPSAPVKEFLAAMLYAGLQSALVGGGRHAEDGDGRVYWRRWVTNPSLRSLLGVVATGASFAVLQPVLGSLILVLEHERWEDAARQCPPGRCAPKHVDAAAVAEVCATLLLRLFTGPAAVNSRRWDEDCKQQLRRYRLTVRGVVRLLRLALRSVDRLLDGAGATRPPSGGDDAEREASVLLRTCVEKQLLAAVMTGLATPSAGSRACAFATRSMRAEMVRLVRDLLERASPPLFFLTCRLVPYLPTLLQIIVDAAKQLGGGEGCDDDEDGRDELPSCQPQAEVLCSAGIETVSLLGVMMWHAPLVRERFLDVLDALHCTSEQREVLFDVMEALARSLPPQAVRGLLIVDAMGTVVNDVSQLRGEEQLQPQLDVLARLLRRQQQPLSRQSRTADRLMPEGRWASVQRQRQGLGPQHGHACRVFVWFVLHHLRGSARRRALADDAEEAEAEAEAEDAAGGVSVSPIQPSTSDSTVGHRVGEFIADLQKSPRCGGDSVLLKPRRAPAVGREGPQRDGEEDTEESGSHDDGASDTVRLQRVSGSQSSGLSRQQPRRAMEGHRHMFSASVGGNAMDPLEHVRQRQLESIAAEKTAYRAALGLFASLASRYYRRLLTPRAALEYLHRQQHSGVPPRRRMRPPTSTPPSRSPRVSNSNTALRLWTPRDVCQEDLFYFSLPLSAITEQAIAELVERCKRHRQVLHRTLQTVPQASRGRRWFLHDAATSIMGRLIALFQVLAQHIQREGEKAVQEALAQMPPLPQDEGDDEDFISNVARRWARRDATPWELHGGSLLEATKFIVRCFPRPTKPGVEKATNSPFQLGMEQTQKEVWGSDEC